MLVRLFLAALVVTLSAACRGDDDSDESSDSSATTGAEETDTEATGTSSETTIGPPASLVVASSELVVGPNRFIFGLFDAENQLVEGLDTSLTLFADAQGEPREIGTFDAEFLALEFPDEEEPPEIGGVYASSLPFEEAGVYGIEVTVEGQPEAPQGLRVFLDVKAEGSGVQVGETAPASDNPTTDDVDDLATIDSDDPPNPELHELSVAEALASGDPTLVAFVTPAFCSSRLCGPMIDVVLAILPEYEGRVNFIHIEPFALGADGQVIQENGMFVNSETFDEWGLTVEPVTFIIDADGVVAFRLESLTTQDELRAALDSVLG